MALKDFEQKPRIYEVVYYKSVRILEDKAKRLVKVNALLEMISPKIGVVTVATMKSLDKNRMITLAQGEEEREIGIRKNLSTCYEFKEVT